jgi:hypothetical protein
MLRRNKGWTAVCDGVRAWGRTRSCRISIVLPKCRRQSGLGSTSQARRVKKRIELKCNREKSGARCVIWRSIYSL